MARTKSSGLSATNAQPAETISSDTNDLNFATGSRHGKAESNLCAALALAGYEVYLLKNGGYVVRNHSNIHHATDLEDLQAFTASLGKAEQSGGCK